MMALLLCAAGVPLLPTNEMKVTVTLLSGCVLSVGIYLCLRSGEMIYATPLDLPIVAFWTVAILSTVFGVNPWNSTFPNITRRQGLLDYFVYLPMALAASRLSRSESRELLAALLGVGSVIAAVGIAQYYGFDPTPWIGGHGLNYGVRSWSTLANPDFLGGYVALVLPIGAAMAAGAPAGPLRGAFGRRWWGYAGAVILLFGALLGSETRSAWAAAALATVILVWRLPHTTQVFRRLGLLTVTCIAVTVVMVTTQPLVSLGGRAESAFNTADSSMQGKLWIWEHVLPMIRERPVLGWGFSAVAGHIPGIGTPSYYRVFGHSDVLIDVAHNDLLQVAVDTGLLGVAAYLWIWVTVIRALTRAGRRTDSPVRFEAVGILAGLVGYFVWLQFLWSHIGDANVFWVLAGIAISVGRAADSLPRSAAGA
jgi:putative inorganic carbon (HCO3(-)) transporter